MNDIKLSDACKCPICESTEVRITGMQPLFEDSRFDYCTCEKCGAEWRFYYKVCDCNIELTQEGNIPEESKSSSDEGAEPAEWPVHPENLQPVIETSSKTEAEDTTYTAEVK